MSFSSAVRMKAARLFLVLACLGRQVSSSVAYIRHLAWHVELITQVKIACCMPGKTNPTFCLPQVKLPQRFEIRPSKSAARTIFTQHSVNNMLRTLP